LIITVLTRLWWTISLNNFTTQTQFYTPVDKGLQGLIFHEKEKTEGPGENPWKLKSREPTKLYLYELFMGMSITYEVKGSVLT
jgi:hypothetical protein